jgi:hypothetical protein
MYLCGRWQEKFGPFKLADLGAGRCGRGQHAGARNGVRSGPRIDPQPGCLFTHRI